MIELLVEYSMTNKQWGIIYHTCISTVGKYTTRFLFPFHGWPILAE